MREEGEPRCEYWSMGRAAEVWAHLQVWSRCWSSCRSAGRENSKPSVAATGQIGCSLAVPKVCGGPKVDGNLIWEGVGAAGRGPVAHSKSSTGPMCSNQHVLSANDSISTPIQRELPITIAHPLGHSDWFKRRSHDPRPGQSDLFLSF